MTIIITMVTVVSNLIRRPNLEFIAQLEPAGRPMVASFLIIFMTISRLIIVKTIMCLTNAIIFICLINAIVLIIVVMYNVTFMITLLMNNVLIVIITLDIFTTSILITIIIDDNLPHTRIYYIYGYQTHAYSCPPCQ